MSTELEHAVLGFLWREGPCSAYSVQRVFELVSTGWSSSPGSIYPLLARLERAGLAVSRREPWGARHKTLFEISAEGRRQLLAWIADLPEWTGRPPIDPIRTKSFFLKLLPNDLDRLAFVRQAESRTHAAMQRLEQGIASLDAEAFSYDRLAQIGGICQLEARLKWLEVVRRALQKRADRAR